MNASRLKSETSFQNKIIRFLWTGVWFLLFLPSPRPLHVWRVFLLRIFGANIGVGVKVYGTARIYYPPNLYLESHSTIGPRVEIYNVDLISIGNNSIVSQNCYLCTATHDYTKTSFPLVTMPIVVGENSWLCANSFIGPGVKVGDNVVVAACSAVVKSIPDKTLVGGNPAKQIKTL